MVRYKSWINARRAQEHHRSIDKPLYAHDHTGGTKKRCF